MDQPTQANKEKLSIAEETLLKLAKKFKNQSKEVTQLESIQSKSLAWYQTSKVQPQRKRTCSTDSTSQQQIIQSGDGAHLRTKRLFLDAIALLNTLPNF